MATFGAMLNVRSKLGCFCSDAVSIWKPWYHNVALNYIFIAQIIYFNWIDINQCLLHTDSHINKERLDWIRQTIFFRDNVFRLADQLQCHIGFELSSHECSAVNFDKTWHSQLEIVCKQWTKLAVGLEGKSSMWMARRTSWHSTATRQNSKCGFPVLPCHPRSILPSWKKVMVRPLYFSLLNIMWCLAHYWGAIVMLSLIHCYISGRICYYLKKWIKSTVLDDPVSLVVDHVTWRRDPAGTGAESLWLSGAKPLPGLMKT